MINIFGRPIWDYLRACGACGTAFRPVDFFCEACWIEFRRRSNRGARLRAPQEDFPVHALWTWTEDNDVFLRPLIYALKGAWGAAIVDKLVEDLSFARDGLPARERDFRVALPPRRPGCERDHAWMLAHAFAGLWRMPVWDGLALDSPPGVGAQKGRNARERRRLLYRTKGALPAASSWVFLDDVVTTGATARAAFLALGKPPRFEVWALAYRPPPQA